MQRAGGAARVDGEIVCDGVELWALRSAWRASAWAMLSVWLLVLRDDCDLRPDVQWGSEGVASPYVQLPGSGRAHRAASRHDGHDDGVRFRHGPERRLRRALHRPWVRVLPHTAAGCIRERGRLDASGGSCDAYVHVDCAWRRVGQPDRPPDSDGCSGEQGRAALLSSALWLHRRRIRSELIDAWMHWP